MNTNTENELKNVPNNELNTLKSRVKAVQAQIGEEGEGFNVMVNGVQVNYQIMTNFEYLFAELSKLNPIDLRIDINKVPEIQAHVDNLNDEWLSIIEKINHLSEKYDVSDLSIWNYVDEEGFFEC
jgi:hypothetical protein